ncbi:MULTISPECIES: tRNA (adenosine(37)-N6)-threonylcarbamoyltransferase complex ATPase subunit type 1 TsaE [Cetobacterium]|jgi:tRNA threonylcarbamoyladenosine biosynthesis protein TsaE|uniref:tRNA threonylcarbamoyladenosine biosynthesis protein TsaE n=1 Tax=Candidatus Cetobacterium colombiensis TaxID=3073100 RepID=A0ABU4WBC2_9FUSO|nr:tRNA (adenosine(37)-N6)-threonylcarbamoyltransferase complex ATPase subunit type 1 TsaE [Candidatus Cetobacterium colombiensis]MDX8335695.1 tRNA (adenosine(37)-N6)-threonylcarbamoyltransferase complex ATPase subunit type 1 TsaE [Candidatus Cetobacterium colombiensis]
MKKTLKFEEIDRLAQKLAEYVSPNTVVALIGDLGTGKTTFTKTFAKYLGVDETLKSPTFNYVLEYLEGRLPLYHFDVYRLGSPEEIYEIGYEDYINNDGVALIEWANIIESELPKKYIKITFDYDLEKEDLNVRKVSLEYIGDKEKEEEMLNYVGFSN